VSERRARTARRSGRARSQHFLRRSVAAELVRDSGIGPDDLVVDLGAGSGRLTAELARAARGVVAVELDPHLADRLGGRWSNVEVVQADAGTVHLPSEPFRVVANLPFDRTNDILGHLLDDPLLPLVRADLVVEWGVAVKRAVPWPSSIKGVLWGASHAITLARRLPRSAFEPSPAVDAGVLVFARRAEPLVPLERADEYGRFVASGFRRGLRAVASRRALGRVGVSGANARDLDAHQWAALYAAARR